MGSFQHFLITKFNVRNHAEQWKQDREGNPVLDDAWLQHRLGLFKKFCLPSVLGQSTSGFEWLIFLDQNSPESLISYFFSLSESNCLINPVLTPADRTFNKVLLEDLEKRLDQSTHLITTRFDNDDSLALNAIESIQQQFKEQEYQAINLTVGYALQPGVKNSPLYRLSLPGGPFLSLIERRTDMPPRTVLQQNHPHYKKDKTLIQLQDQPYWLKVVHERNLRNTARGKPILEETSLKELFGIEVVYQPPGLMHRLAYKLGLKS